MGTFAFLLAYQRVKKRLHLRQVFFAGAHDQRGTWSFQNAGYEIPAESHQMPNLNPCVDFLAFECMTAFNNLKASLMIISPVK